MTRPGQNVARSAIAKIEQLPQPELLRVVERLTSRLEPVPIDPAKRAECEILHRAWWAARQRRHRESLALATGRP